MTFHKQRRLAIFVSLFYRRPADIFLREDAAVARGLIQIVGINYVMRRQ